MGNRLTPLLDRLESGELTFDQFVDAAAGAFKFRNRDYAYPETDANDDMQVEVSSVTLSNAVYSKRLSREQMKIVMDEAWPWDLRLRNAHAPGDRTRIEVRSGTSSVSIDGGRYAHVWIFVTKSSIPGEPASYSVAPSARVAKLRESVRKPSFSRIEDEFGQVNLDALRGAVEKCRRAEPAIR